MNPVSTDTLPGETPRVISREEMANLPIRRYDGEVCLVTTPQELERARADMLQETVVGFDTETRPSFRKGESHLPCLVQVATAGTVYLFRPERPDASRLLAELLQDARIAKAGVALADDLRSLKLVFPFQEKAMLDLGIVARRSGLGQTGVRNLAGMFLGYRIPKGASTSNWAAQRLSPAQITYAATDAWVCRELFLHFQNAGLLPTRNEP